MEIKKRLMLTQSFVIAEKQKFFFSHISKTI